MTFCVFMANSVGVDMRYSLDWPTGATG